MTRAPYPLTPKSTARMRPGQFWSIPLSNNRFACGRVLQVARAHGRNDTRMFLAGLMDWTGDAPPEEKDLVGRAILEIGQAHIRTITELGAQILGCRALEDDGLTVPVRLTHSLGPGIQICRGYDFLRPATAEEQRMLPVLTTWGYGVITILAERHFAGEEESHPPRSELDTP